MKLATLVLLTACMQVSATAYSQQAHISFSLHRASLEDVFHAIGTQSDYQFLYNDENLRRVEVPLSLKVSDASIEQVMDLCLKDLPLSYRIIDKIIVITPKHSVGDSALGLPQPVVVSGTVADTTGRPLVGVSVKVAGTTTGTVSGPDGAFTVDAPLDAVLEFSYIGYESKRARASGSAPLHIILSVATGKLSQLMVIGYGTQKKSDVTGAISGYKPDDLHARPVLGLDQMMQGRMAGVNVSYGSGTPGGAVRVSVRGTGSLSASNSPLYVIDGVPIDGTGASIIDFGESMDPLAQLNPNDIASIDVLKDAASAAIYGSRATNGVILITTKKGKKGASQFNVNAYAAMQWIPNLDKIAMSGSKLFVDVQNEAINNYNQEYNYNPGDSKYIPYIYNPYPGLRDVNWLDLVLRTAYAENIDVSASGGSDKSTYYISGGFMNQQGTVIQNDYKKYNTRINLSSHPLSWLHIGSNISMSYTHNNRVPGSNLGTTILGRALPQRPFDRPYKPDGSYYVGGTEDLKYHNPIQVLNEENAYLDNYRLLGNLYADLNLTKDLVFKTSFGTDLIYTHDYVYYNQNHPYGTGNGRNVDDRRLLSNLLLENTLHYTKKVGGLGLDLVAGHSYQRQTGSTSYLDGNGFPAPSFDVIAAASIINDASTNLYGNAMESYFGRANLNWKDRYLLSLSMRTDGSSRFAPTHRYGYFPSASAGWQLSREKWWTARRTDLKLRVSYGATGNQAGISNYAYQSLTYGGYNYNNKSGIAILSYGNDKLTWEKATQFDVGVDMGILDGAVDFTVDYFDKNTTNLLYDMPIQATSGFTSITSNIGSMLNRGVEFGVNSRAHLGPVSWTLDFNISYIKNEITSLIGDNDVLSIGGNRGLKVGEDIGSFWVYKMIGIYQNDKDVPQPLYDMGVRAGDVKYQDVNGDGKIDINDRQILGSSTPKFYGGFNNTFRYKGFDLTVFFNYSYGAKVYASYRVNTEKLGLSYFNTTKSVALDRWTGPGTSNTVPRAIYGLGYNIYNSSRWLEDGSFIRLRSLSAGYELPGSIVKKVGISQLRVYLQADNLWLITKYSGLDPEVNSSMDPRYMSDDNLMLPQPRSVSLGVNLKF